MFIHFYLDVYFSKLIPSFEDSLSAHKYNQFVDIFSLEVQYGTYKARLEIQDNSSLKKGEYLFDINTIEPEKELSLSDIELCTHLSMDSTKSLYYKKNFKQIKITNYECFRFIVSTIKFIFYTNVIFLK